MTRNVQERAVRNSDRVWDLITVGVILAAAALSFVWFLPQP